MLESLKRKQKEITTTICTYQKSTEVAKPQSVASSNSKPVDKLAENRTPSKLDVDWDAESTEEYLPFESPTKRSRTVLLDNIIPVNEIPNLSYARTSTVVEKPIAGKLRASGGTDVIARAKHNSLRRETVRNRCWFFQNG